MGGGLGGGMGIPIPIGAGGGGIGLIGLIVAILFFTGVLGGGGGGVSVPGIDPMPGMPQDGSLQAGSAEDQKLVDFVGFVVNDVQQSWAKTFEAAGRTYEPTKLVLFTDATTTGCGNASSATGPFYCPADRKVYLDLGFFRELRQRFGAPGDFAQAYVIAHEFGHHVQNLLGISGQLSQEQQANPGEANALSVKLELQADCLAGVWAQSAYRENLLQTGDLEEGLRAAAAVGDDRLQRQATGRIDRESWTHGSSAQRVHWLKAGYESGDPNACDTFGGGA
jgi:predicted metalloprotease